MNLLIAYNSHDVISPPGGRTFLRNGYNVARWLSFQIPLHIFHSYIDDVSTSST